MSLLKVILEVLFIIFLAFLTFGSALMTADEYWQRVRLFLIQKGIITSTAKITKRQIKEIWKRLPLKKRFTAHLPQYKYPEPEDELENEPRLSPTST